MVIGGSVGLGLQQWKVQRVRFGGVGVKGCWVQGLPRFQKKKEKRLPRNAKNEKTQSLKS